MRTRTLWTAVAAAAVALAMAALGPAARAQGTDTIQAVKLAPHERLTLNGTLAHPAWARAPHFDARHTLRLIEQRGALDRRAEPARGVAEERLRGHVESLTYAWRRSAGTVFYLGATRSRADAAAPRVTEAFAKLQFDVDDVWR